ncbi:uncharacterized protein K452DRAFT_300090 [Aplosporella prunicola CBS 121167]|uniref:Uncharacterized protein n=1 Tax=Aplosporella prunicola CBS 121167 TaxID=1176127 RepID=A0A6A6B5Y4_9PEZI|nr:uncharacterized protein K452DRAFT_300090 [Aplosporella prunicola CBS 121167]KAF2139529.1 hypothetical protein K452DRAFT_300090 [Aplosporella prunicola CBS 121167]
MPLDRPAPLPYLKPLPPLDARPAFSEPETRRRSSARAQHKRTTPSVADAEDIRDAMNTTPTRSPQRQKTNTSRKCRSASAAQKSTGKSAATMATRKRRRANSRAETDEGADQVEHPEDANEEEDAPGQHTFLPPGKILAWAQVSSQCPRMRAPSSSVNWLPGSDDDEDDCEDDYEASVKEEYVKDEPSFNGEASVKVEPSVKDESAVEAEPSVKDVLTVEKEPVKDEPAVKDENDGERCKPSSTDPKSVVNEKQIPNSRSRQPDEELTGGQRRSRDMSDHERLEALAWELSGGWTHRGVGCPRG